MYERMNPHKVAPELRQPMFGLTQHIAGNIDPTLFELIKLYASMLNGCAHCIDIHSSDALKAGGGATRPLGFFGSRRPPLFPPRERAAPGHHAAATRLGPHGVPDEVFEAARIEFDDRELTYVVAAIGLTN